MSQSMHREKTLLQDILKNKLEERKKCRKIVTMWNYQETHDGMKNDARLTLASTWVTSVGKVLKAVIDLIFEKWPEYEKKILI